MNEVVDWNGLIELIMLPSPCFSVKLPEITLTAIEATLEKAYLNWLFDPQYLFCSKHDSEKIGDEVRSNTNICRTVAREAEIITRESYKSTPAFILSPVRLTKLTNQTTGRLMSVIELPEHEDGTLLFGFITS